MHARRDADLAATTRTAATLAAMLALIATAVAPADDATRPTTSPATTQSLTTQSLTTQTTTTQLATMPATTSFTTAPTTTSVTVVVNVPPAATQPASKPVVTEETVLERRRQGDLVGQVVAAFGDAGVKQTFVQTKWWAWFYALLSVAIGTVIARAVAGLLGRFGTRAAERVELLRAVVIHSFAGPVGLFLFCTGLGVGLHFLEITPAGRLILTTLFQLLFNVIVGWLLYNLVEVVSLILTRLSRGRQGNLSVMLVPIVRRVLRATIIVLLGLFTLNNVFSMPVQTLLAGVGIAGLAVSLAAQDTLKNLFGSVMIFADQPFLMGDLVRVDAFEGVVEDIGFRSTRIRTAEGFLISIPNARVADAAVTNLSRRKATRRVLDVGLPYDATPQQVDAALAILRGVVADPAVAADFDARRGEPSVALDELRPGGMRARVVYWTRATDADAQARHAERVNLMIVRRFADAGLRFSIVG